MPGLHKDDEPEAAGRLADLLERGVGDPHSRPSVDQIKLAFERGQSRRMLGEHRAEHRPNSELFSAVALELGLDDGAFDHLDLYGSVLDVLWRNDRPGEMKAGRAVEVTDRARDRHEVRLRDMLSEIGLIGCGDTIRSNGSRAADAYVAQHKLRTGIGAVIGTAHGGQFDRRASAGVSARSGCQNISRSAADRSPADSPAARGIAEFPQSSATAGRSRQPNTSGSDSTHAALRNSTEFRQKNGKRTLAA